MVVSLIQVDIGLIDLQQVRWYDKWHHHVGAFCKNQTILKDDTVICYVVKENL